MITEGFAPLFLRTINELRENPVHLLFNQWWQHAPKEVVEAYRAQLLADPGFARFVEDRYYAEPVDLERLGRLPESSMGKRYHDWIVDNGLTAQIAMDYGRFHRFLVKSGQLDGMPDELQYAILRGFQLHDFLHVLTGYDPSPGGEIALQAFSLAQLQFPYFAMWISTTTTQMTYSNPKGIVPLMDAITDGWSYGRKTPQLSFHRWEDEVERDLDELRAEWGVEPTPFVAALWERRNAVTSA